MRVYVIYLVIYFNADYDLLLRIIPVLIRVSH